MKLTLKQLEEITGGKIIQGSPDLLITSFVNAEQIKSEDPSIKNGLYFPILRFGDDRHQYIQNAFEKGAIATFLSNSNYLPLLEKYPNCGFIQVQDLSLALKKLGLYLRKRVHSLMIAVTGSNGKTTTKDILYHIITPYKEIYKSEANSNAWYRMPYHLSNISPIQQLAVIEIGMGAKDNVNWSSSLIQPDISIITCVSEQHMDNFSTTDEIAEEKSTILSHTNQNGYVFLNADDFYFNFFTKQFQGKVYSFGLENPEADIKAKDIVLTSEGSYFTFEFEETREEEVYLPLLGKHNIYNVLPCIVIAYNEGIPLSDIKARLRELKPPEQRFEVYKTNEGTDIIIDSYGAGLSGVKTALDTFIETYQFPRRILVLSDMVRLGERSEEYHNKLAEHISELRDELDLVITIGEDSSLVSKKLKTKGLHFKSRENAFVYLKTHLEKDTAILIKGLKNISSEEILTSLKRG